MMNEIDKKAVNKFQYEYNFCMEIGCSEETSYIRALQKLYHWMKDNKIENVEFDNVPLLNFTAVCRRLTKKYNIVEMENEIHRILNVRYYVAEEVNKNGGVEYIVRSCNPFCCYSYGQYDSPDKAEEKIKDLKGETEWNS